MSSVFRRSIQPHFFSLEIHSKSQLHSKKAFGTHNLTANSKMCVHNMNINIFFEYYKYNKKEEIIERKKCTNDKMYKREHKQTRTTIELNKMYVIAPLISFSFSIHNYYWVHSCTFTARIMTVYVHRCMAAFVCRCTVAAACISICTCAECRAHKSSSAFLCKSILNVFFLRFSRAHWECV